jgi:riboflavin biosynthesis pyrimidine reductase
MIKSLPKTTIKPLKTSLSKPEVTLMLASSIDGRLVSRDSDRLDSNKKWKKSNLVKSIIYQFFDFSENKTVYNLTSGSSMVRVGVNSDSFTPKKSSVRLVVLDSDKLLTAVGVTNLAKSVQQLILVTDHSQRHLKKGALSNCNFFFHKGEVDLVVLLKEIGKQFNVQKLTVQSEGLMNSNWIEAGIVDHLTVILFPILVSDNGTPTLVSNNNFSVRPLRLISMARFDDNYISLNYDVINSKKIDN